MTFDLLEALREPWQPVSRAALRAWLAFYAIFLAYAFSRRNGFLITDYIFLPIHEGGHLLFGWFGHTLGILGGTILQLGVPFAMALYFSFQRHLAGTSFALFFFFNNFLNIASYMADSRRQALQYVTVGNAEFAEHDWATIFIQLGVLQHDMQIASVVRLLGWMGMIGVLAWFYRRAHASIDSGGKAVS
jgi:hypothetical protein